MINVAVLVNSMANIRPKSVIILIGAVRPGPKYGHARKKTAGYHLFRNVLPECNSILGSQLTAAATQLFMRDVRKRPKPNVALYQLQENCRKLAAETIR